MTRDSSDLSSRAAQNRRASTRHPERAAVSAANEGPKLAKPSDTPPAISFISVANKAFTLNPRKRGPRMALAWPLGDAWVAQGPPKPKPKQAVGRSLNKNTLFQRT